MRRNAFAIALLAISLGACSSTNDSEYSQEELKSEMERVLVKPEAKASVPADTSTTMDTTALAPIDSTGN